MPLIRIKCPNPQCKVEISIDFTPSIIYKDVFCPYCKQTAPYWKWAGWKWPAPEGWTWEGYPNPPIEGPKNGGDPPPPPPPPPPPQTPVKSVARLVRLRSSEVYELDDSKASVVVGREAKSSTADIQIPDVTHSCRMSRSHLVIEKRMEYGQKVYYASLYETDPMKRVNPTFVNNYRMMVGETVMLNSGDIINMPNELLRFEIIKSDTEETELAF